MIEIINGDILDADTKYIAHQTNCVSTLAGGLAGSIFEKYPYADIYKSRQSRSEPGTIVVCGNGQDQRFIINMNSQYYPGPYNDSYENDSLSARHEYFRKCLSAIGKIKDIESITFPYRVGCGLAGGDWEWYEDMLNKFSDFLNISSNVKVQIYKLGG